MTLYKFFHKTSKRVALSTDVDGGNLPGTAKDWTRQSTVEISRGGPEHVGFPNDKILDAIEKDGYFAP
ncbi:hypothetical protein NKI88_18220 [Mesorhizobium sp. M0317]|uniref:hypothetical protein n=1 Tax=Mesorhizobium sp. M0317 TaxID=2956935 RepID=UPI003337CB61